MDNTFDKIFYCEGELIGGIDESGVSDIAGPLVAACVVLPKLDPRLHDVKVFEAGDSKQMPEKYRRQYAEIIWQTAIAIGIGEVQPTEIDYLTKYNAVCLAMLRAVVACKTTAKGKPVTPDFLLVDGHIPAPVKIRQATVREGDKKSLCTAAASVVAKVYRDEIMLKLHEQYPHYAWDKNKGFPCDEHLAGVDKHGIQVGVHRIRSLSFAVKRVSKEGTDDWRARRVRWERITTDNLCKEVGEHIWTTKPPSERRFSDYSNPLSADPSSGETSKGFSKRPKKRPTRTSSPSCTGTSSRPSS